MKKTDAGEFFTAAERARIRQAVAAAEKTTSGEIATMVVSSSDSYHDALAFGALLGAATLALLVAVVDGHITIWTYLPLTTLCYFPLLWIVRRFPLLQRAFIANARLEGAVKSRAIMAFYEKGLYRTKDETGILVFISLLERKVWILGDRGINARIAPDTWTKLVQRLTGGLREGKACDALCEVISLCGEELTLHFPLEAGNINELQDEILVGQ